MEVPLLPRHVLLVLVLLVALMLMTVGLLQKMLARSPAHTGLHATMAVFCRQST
jgi:hypothetical protein